ncbi:MAG: alpha/beta hydrolase [Gemmatimonadetes bacterium]|nr:alpha/beta hydrolase [Gemmatimonadota bacterium]
MFTSLLRIAGVLLAVYVALCALAWRYQDRLAFPAPRTRLPDPFEFRIPNAERISVTTSDGVVLRGWYLAPTPLPREGQRAAGLIWFYGNMETLAYIGPILRYLRPPQTGIVALDYRGYGESDSAATEAGIYRDADAAWEYLAHRPEIDPGRIAVYGRSVGSVPALYLATTRQAQAVILDSPMTSAREMAALHYGFLPGFLIHLSLNNRERAARLSVPLLVFHGTKDLIAPVAMGEAIARAGKGELVRIEGAGHNETYDIGDEQYRQRMWAFLAQMGEEGRRKREE